MLELGRGGTAGTQQDERPVLRDGDVVATLRASNWKEAAAVVVGDRSWIYANRRGELTGRRAEDPADTVRLRALRTSLWKGTWAVELEGTTLDRVTTSIWRGTHAYLTGHRQVAGTRWSGGWSPRPRLDAEDSVPLDHQVFLLWLELVINRRNTAALTAATGAAVVGGSS